MKGIFTAVTFSLLLFLPALLNAQITPSSQWTWMKGDSTGNQPGVYGTKGVASAANKPSARNGHITWTDNSGNFWLFGGYAGGQFGSVLNDLWKYNVSTNQWTWVTGDSTKNGLGIYGTKGIAGPSNTPRSRTNGASWTDATGNLWLFGGGESNFSGFKLNDIWKFNSSINQWTWVSGDSVVNPSGVYGVQGTPSATNKPPGRIDAAFWVDANGDCWLFGGLFIGGSFNDLWKYNPITNQWTWMKGNNTGGETVGIFGTMGTPAPSNTPGSLFGTSSWTDDAGKLWLFGGRRPSSADPFNTLWKYDPLTNNWTWINGSNTANASAVYGIQGMPSATNIPRSTNNSNKWKDAYGNFWLYSGWTSGDLWKYNVATNQWTWMKGYQPNRYGTMGIPNEANSPGTRFISSGWTDAVGNFWLFGGSGYSNDLWKLSNIVSAQPNLLINDVSHSESNSGTTTYSFTVSLSSPAPAGGVTFNIATADGTAMAGSDYVARSLTGQTIPAGNSTYTFDVLVNGDVAVEPDETFFVNVTNATNATITDGQGLGTIVNDDCNPITINPAAMPNATVGVPYNSPAITITTVGGYNATYSGGGNPAPGLSFLANNTISGTPTTAGTYHTLTVTVTNGANCPAVIKNYNIIVNPAATPPNLTINDVSHNEGNTGTNTYTYTVGLSAPAPAGGVTFNIATANGTATAGSDYAAKSLTAQTIPAGSSTYTFDVLVNSDLLFEPDETFFVNVTGATNATITDGQGLGTIVNDDCSPIIIAPATLPNATQGTPYSQLITFTGGSGSVTAALTGDIPPGLNFTGNTISGTPATAGSYTFIVTATATNGCTEPSSKTYTITVDPPAPPNLTINDVSHSEGNSGTTTYTFTVSLSAPAVAGGVTFNIATANSTATAGSDYVAKSLTAQTIPAGSATYTFDVQVNGDLLFEPNETFFVNVSNVTGAVITDGQGIGTIMNDDAAPIAQTISFPSLPNKTVGDLPFQVSATASSGLPVTFRIVSGPAVVTGDMITLTGVGTVVVEASQAGNTVYNPAIPVQQTFMVSPDLNLPDLAVQNVVAAQTVIASNDTVALSWNVINVGRASSVINWTERIYMQSADGQNRTFLKQVNVANNNVLDVAQTIFRSTVVTIPNQFNIGDEGVFVVELIPGAAIHETAGATANNTGIQQTPWTVLKSLSLQLSASQITEGGEGITAVVNRTGSLTNALTSNISLNYPGHFSFPASVIIPAGQAGVSFAIAAPDNAAIDGTIKDMLRISAAGFQMATAALSLLDNDKASLAITALPAQAMEGSSVTFSVTTNLAPLAPLPIFLTSSNLVRFPVPTSVTIPAGSLSADVTVSLQQDSIPEVDLGVSITAGAASHNPASATIQVKDDDLPNLALIIQTNMISEGAGPYATQVTLRRTATSNAIAFTANLSASLPNTLILPPAISLVAGQNEKSFTIGVIENSLVDSQRQVLVTASIFVSSCGCSAPPASSGSVSASIIVNDNDGATLKLTTPRLTLPEGSANAGLLRVTRNTNTATALLVNLTSSDTTEAVVPATVLIPVGQFYVDVPITTINDGISDGSQTVYFQTTASGYATGSVWVIVTDLNKPDLQIAAVTLSSASIQSADVFNYQVAVKNTGFATAPPGVLVRGYLSSDTIIDASDSLISEDIISGPIGIGQTVTVINAARPSRLPGYYKLLFWVNPEATLAELLATNNTSQPANLALLPDYTATAIVSPAYFIQGTPVPVTGAAVRINGTPAANERIEVYIITNGLRRKVLATTNAAGNYTAQFIPLAKEAGHYSVGASFPGMGETKEQDAFDILGVRINESIIPQFRVLLKDTLTGSVTVQNLSSYSLTHFSLYPVTLPNGARFRFDTIPVLPGNTTVNLSYTITSSTLSAGNDFETVSLQAKADEGLIQKTDVYYFCQAPGAYVLADISNIHVTASQSIGQRIIEFKLINKGRGSTGNVTVQLPQVAWMSSITPKTLPSIAPGDTAIVILKFLTLPEVPFNYPITGNININVQNGNSFPIPFSFEKVSQTSGTVKITVTNQFTYYTDGAPKVKNALVKVKNYFSGVVYAEGYTDSAGAFTASGVPEGKHRVTVDKDQHLPYNGTITINPGDTVSSTVFMNYQAITFSWNVVPTAVQDKYDITLTAKFETHIPIPVVTIEMPDTMPQLFGSDVFAFNATLTNHGLITAKDVMLALPKNDPEYEFVINYEPSDLLAQQSIQVPVLMRRRTSPFARSTNGGSSIEAVSQFLGMQTSQYSAAAATSGSSSNCRDFAGVIWWYPCAFEILQVSNGIPFIYSGRICSSGPLPIVVNIPPNYPTFPCAICPTIILPPATGVPPKFSNEKKSCVICIAKIIESIAECSEAGAPVKALICGVVTTAEHPGLAYLKCIPEIIPDPIKCTFTVIETIQACLGSFAGGASSSQMSAVTNQAQRSAMSSPLGAAFQEIATNLRIVADAYQVRDKWAREYFGDIAESDAWNQLSPKLEPFITNVYSIGSTAQATILAGMAGYGIEPSALQAFFTRWNYSVHALNQGVLQPNAQYPGIINWLLVKTWSDSLINANKLAISKGFISIEDMYRKEYEALNEVIDGQSNAVCASVTVQFSQQLTMTREAFEGTLEIFNGHPTDAMDSLSVNLQITDKDGIPSNGLFEIQTKSLTNLADVTGTGAISAQQKGLVKFLFIPESGAAPQVPKEYNFGGWVRYWDPYARAMVTLPLASVPLTVNPSPNLVLHYFMERNILGDDALTSPDIEPSVPAELAVMVENQGYGPAVNMTISSAQPKVVDNEKGLAINFNLIGSNFQGQPRTLGVTNINFGTILPLQTRIGQWYFTSSLLGKFVSYEADVVHANSFGNPELSLIKDIKLHELTRSIREYTTDDGINDFLVNDIFDVNDRPDVIYFSQGNRKAKVYPAATGSFSSPVLPPSFTNTLTVTASDTGWNYIQLADPGNKLYELVSVTRNDGQVIPLSNAWTTFVTLPVSRQPVYENKFHFVDSFPSVTPVSYTVVWKLKNGNVPKVDSITGIPQQVTSTQVQNVKVVFNKRINPATFTHEDLTLTFQGGPNIMDNAVIITQIDSVTFNVNLSALTTGNGFYALTVQAANVSDMYGTNGLIGKQATWSQFLTVPTVQAFQGIPASRISAAFDTIQVLFNLPIDEATVTPARFTITKDGVLQSGTLTVDSVRADHKLFYLSGLGNILTQTGQYLLTVDLPNIKTVNNIFGTQPQSVKLTLDNTGPVLLNFAKSDSGSIDLHHVPFVHIQFEEDVVGFNTASVQLTRNGEVLPLPITQISNTDLKTWVAGNFGLLTYPEGNYTFTIQLDSIRDAGGNRGIGTQQITWTVNRSALIVTAPVITPDLGFSGTDGITSGQSFQVAFSISDSASQITVSQFDLSGEAALTVIPTVPAGNVSLPVTLLAGGNTGIKIAATGANGRVGTSQRMLFIDQLPLTAQWLFVANQTLTKQPDTIAISFSSRLLSDAGFLEAMQLRQNGLFVPATALRFHRLNDTLYHVYGLRQVSTNSGNYELSLNLQSFKKYSSGRSDSGSVSISWILQKDNHAPIANAGNDTTLATPGLVTLNGTGSSDPDADPITYRWIAPAGIVLSDSTSATPSFTLTNVHQEPVYSFLLIVSDGLLFTTDVVKISFNPSLCSGSKPVIISKNITVNLDAMGHASIQPGDVIQSITDSCAADYSSLTVSPNSFSCSDSAVGSGNHQAYVASTTTGNQSWQGELGMKFRVNNVSGIVVKQLGTFDHLGDGITGNGIRVAVFNKATQTIVPGLDVTISGTADHYTGNHRMKDVTPVTLMPGDYVMVSKGYNADNPNGNGGIAGAPYAFGDSGGGAVSFVNGGLYGDENASTFTYPPNSDPNNYLAGTFVYDVPVNLSGNLNHQAYIASTTIGNQSWQGELGMTFKVNNATGIVVKQLGTFDHLGDGITGTQNGGIRVAIFNKTTHTIVPGLDAVIVGNADHYTANHRMKDMPPVTLLPGEYVIVSKGYNANELNGNGGTAGAPYAFGDIGGGAVSFTSGGLYGDENASTFGYPTYTDLNNYLAGTFVYDVPATASGGTNKQAYVASTTTGNQSWQGELGMEFRVNNVSGIVVKQLGTFDHLGDGITGNGIRVAVFNKATQTIVPGLDVTISGTADYHTGNHRMKDVTPVTLMPGDYVMVSKGYNADNPNGNGGIAGAPYAFGDSGGGAVSFVNGGLYGDENVSTFTYPLYTDPNNYLAGTFMYDVPENTSGGLGNNIVTISVKDRDGNISYATATVSVQDVNGVCNPSSVIAVAANVAVSEETDVRANEPKAGAENLLVYPNPSNGSFSVQLPNLKTATASIEVYDANGVVIEKRPVSAVGKPELLTVRFSLLNRPSGMYYIKVTSTAGVQTAKLILQR